MSILFTPFKLGGIQLKNRFVFSACEDNLAAEDGSLTDNAVKKNARLAGGEVGLIISSHMAVHPSGRNVIHQPLIYTDAAIAGLKAMTEAVHEHGGRIVFQLGYSGVVHNPTRGQDPFAVNSLPEESIREVIKAFQTAAERAVKAAADGIQLHAAHGYLINQFLSPYFNLRTDNWGGSEENRFRLLREIISATRKVLPESKLLLVKLNTNDYTRTPGITPSLAVNYAKYLAELKIDGLEVSCGTTALSTWYVCRGDIPVPEVLSMFDPAARPQIEPALRKMQESVKFSEGYNVEAARMIRPVMGNIPLFAVGGWRNVDSMENAINNGDTDLISMCRPFIREPLLVRRIREGKTSASSCTSCNRCYVAIRKNIPVRCYSKGLPQ